MTPDTDRPTDSDTLARAHATLRQQEAKGRGKYGADLDGAGLSALQLLTHATEEAADQLMYLTALQKAVAELEAELSATERTADAERDRAKRAERLLESESTRVAELEASVTYEHNRFKRRGGELDRLDARVAELERSLSSTETHRQSLAHELSRAQQLEEAALKTIARKDAKIEAMEAEVQRLKSEVSLLRIAGRAVETWWLEVEVPKRVGAPACIFMLRAALDTPYSPPSPTTRPLTTADRFPMVGDVLACPVGGTLACVQAGTEYKFVVNDLGGYVWRDRNHLHHTRPHEYISRADGGPVVMDGADGG